MGIGASQSGARSEGSGGTGRAEEEGRATPVVSGRQAPLVPICSVPYFRGRFVPDYRISGDGLPYFRGRFEVASVPIIKK